MARKPGAIYHTVVAAIRGIPNGFTFSQVYENIPKEAGLSRAQVRNSFDNLYYRKKLRREKISKGRYLYVKCQPFFEPVQHTTVPDLLRSALPDDHSPHTELQQQIDSRRIVRRLALWRNLKGLSERSVDKTMGRHASCVENGLDDFVSVGEIKAYARAGGASLEELLIFLAGDGK